MLVQLLSKTPKQLKEHCALLSSEEKQSLYSKVLNEVKNTPRDSREGLDKLKKLSKVAVAIEETIDLEKFNDDHPLREVSIAYVSEEATNYLFSLSDSSELYDLKEDREKAIYQAIKSNDRELVKHLLMILTSGDIKIEFFKELGKLLSEAYEELKENLSQDMKNYLEKNISLKRFVCSNVNILVAKPVDVRAMINLFIVQSGVNYKIDELLLIKIAEGLEEGELLSQINQMIETLKKHESTLDYTVGQRVKSWRLERGYTQKDLAEKIGITRQVVLQYEKGTRRISIEKLYAIAEALSVSITDLIPIQRVSKSCLEDEREEILNLARNDKKTNDQELRKIFYLLTKSAQLSEKSSRKAERVEIAKNLVKAGISVDIVSKTIGLSANECIKEKTGSIYYKIGKKIKEWRLVPQEDLAKKIGITRHKISKYEQGRTAIPLDKLYDIAEALSISIIDLLPESTENEVENELPSLIEEYKKIENQELRYALIKTLFKGIRICEEKVRKAERIKVAKDLVKEGISIDIIVQTIGLSFGEF
ncbi:uncharacterized protein TNCT_280461 [Trichonephila clavata]|uniref:HTH cro/C1-type domain-containing protein n=1 Tax=Trichonephila clavata TaxID=2740835 RepID=A0A8X6GUJ9_TRICU|nr:uncharacterized protein TNCT_395091 [Trichonephila clavata]GFR11626.1 uncharacterized protein TNCT_280461 [Trichonephila clavata]